MEYLLLKDPATGSEYEYPLEGDWITLGSSDDNSIVLEGAEPFHAEIVRIGQGYKIVDRHTDLGVQVNGEWIMQKVLAHGDRIVIGSQKIKYCDPDRVRAKTAPRQRESAPPAGKPVPGSGSKPRRPRVAAAQAAQPRRPAARPAAANGTRTGHTAPARRPKKKSVLGPIIGVALIGVSLLIIWFVVGKLGGEPEIDPTNDRYTAVFESVAADKKQGYYSAARQRLEGLADIEDPGIAEQVRRELKAIEQLEEHEAMARRQLADLTESLGRDSIEDVEAGLKLYESSFGHLEYLEPDLLEIKRSLAKARAIEEEGMAALTERQVAKRAEERLAAGDYSTALKLWERFVPRNDADRAMERNQIAAIKMKAREEARTLISVATALKGEKKYDEVFELLRPSELARFKQTPLYDQLVNKVSEVEELAGLVPRRLRAEDLDPGPTADATPPAGARPPAGAKKPGGSATTQPGTVAPDRRDPAPSTAPAAKPAIPEGEFKMVDEAIRGWEFDKAISFLQEMIKEAATRDEKNAVSTRIEFTYRQTWFLEDLEMRLTDESDKAVRIPVRTRDGSFAGKFNSFMNSKVYIESGEDIRGFLFEQIEPRSLYNLARAYPIESEERLNIACFCLNNNLKTEFDALAADVSAEGSFRRSIDSFLAMDRGTETVADFGHHLLDGKLVPHQEWREAILNNEIAALIKKIRSRNPDERNEGYRGFLELGPVAFDALQGELEQRYVDLAGELNGFPETGKLDKLAKVKRDLNEMREFALELIFDSARYFYPYKHRQGEYTKVQREVDERVEKVREIWGNEFQEDIPGPKVKLSTKFLAVRDDLNQVALILDDITRGTFQRSSELGYANLLPVRGRVVHVRNFALDETEWEIIDSSAAIIDYNTRVETTATRNESEQVVITNQYRMMMGRRALALNELILQAARGHSEWMSLTGTFSHFQDNEESRTPVDRMALAGYDKGSGENIHMGAGSPMGAHNGWYHSSGHHRNMLAPSHTEMACGVVGRYWTQNFGGGSEFSENLIAD